jgi:WD40 repeat protein/serine/threonine protein kinase
MIDGHDIDEQLLQRLPLPLVQLCRRAQNAKTPLERHLSAYYLWEAALKLLGATAVMEYAELSDHEPQLTGMMKNLARPSVGHWWEFVRRLVPVLADKGDVGFVSVRDLVLGRARDDLPRTAGLYAALTEALEGKSGARTTVRITELFDRLVTYRNREIGHGAAGQKPSEFYQRMGRTLLAGITQILTRVDVLAARRLVYIGDVRRLASGGWLIERYLLVSDAARRLESLELPESEMSRLPRPECVYLEGQRDPRLSVAFPIMRLLSPLVHYDADMDKLFFLNARRGKKQIEYLCYGTGEILNHDSAGKEHQELLARVIGIPVDAGLAESWADQSLADDPAVASDGPRTGTRSVGEFELLSRLGQGGMGVVYRAWQPSLGRQVALKCMLRSGDPKAEARFAREIRALGRTEHPNVVKVFTSGADGDQWFYAMELIEGVDLTRVCDQLTGSSATEVDESHWHEALSRACERARSGEMPLNPSLPPAPAEGSMPTLPGGSRPGGPSPGPRPGMAHSGRGHVRQMVEIVRQVANAVHALHEVGVVHRDIKPGNVMLTADGAHPVLMDLGLAQLADETDGRLTRTRQFVGTLRYASPEQVLAVGQIDRRTDIYSLGVTLWELLTLRPAYGADDNMPMPDLMLKIQMTDLEKPHKYNRHVPRDLEAIVRKCLEKDRSRRYATASDLATDLGRFLSGEAVSAQPPSLTYLTGKFVRRYRAPLAVAAVVFIVLVGGTVAAFVGIDRERRAAIDANEKLQDANLNIDRERRAAIDAKGKLQDANNLLEEQLYSNRIAVAERELSLNQDIGLASDLLGKCPERLRGWEWNYLMRLRDGGRPPLQGHKAGLWTAVFSPNGRQIATASIDGTAKIWDAVSGKEVQTFKGHVIQFAPRTPPVTCLAYSPDGRHIASASLFPNLADITNARKAFGVVKIWDPVTLTETVKYDKQVGLVYCLAYSPDGNRIASSHINDGKIVAVWDTRTGQEIHLFRDIPCHTHRLRYSLDGRFLLAGCTDGTVRIWDAATFELVRVLDAHYSSPVYDLAFCPPDGARFASSGTDGTVRLWETTTGAPLKTLRGHTGAAMGVAFSPDGRRIASAGFDKTVRLWDSTTGEEKLTLRGHTDMVTGVDFSPDGRQLVSASFDKEARIWDTTPGEESTGPGLFTLEGHTDRVNTVAFSADGRRMASGGYDKTVRLWDGLTGRALHKLEGHKGPVWGVAFSPDGTRVASASWDQTVKVWDTESGRELLTFARHGAPVHALTFTPDGKKLISTSWEGLVKVWDPNNGQEFLTFSGHLLPTMAVAVSRDGKQVASGSGDRTVKVWDTDSGRELFTLRGHEGLVHSVAFSPDGKLLASASWDHTVKVWNTSNGKEVLTFKHDDRVQGVAFSPDGMRIASASEDKTVRIWEAATGREILSRHHRGVVWSVSFSPDGKRVATGCWSSFSFVKTWKVE